MPFFNERELNYPVLSGISRLNKALEVIVNKGCMKYYRFKIGRSTDMGLRTDFCHDHRKEASKF